MKVKVSNISSGLLALPAPLSVTLPAGKGTILSMSDPEWKAACSSPSIARLIQARMLSMSAVQDAPPKPVAVVATPVVEEPKVEEPKAPEPVVEALKAEEPVVAPAEEPVAEPEAPAEEPAAEEPKAEEPKAEAPVEKKKKKKN